MPADDELSTVLSRRQQINEALDEGKEIKPSYKVVNIYTDFHEFTRKEIKQYEATFIKFDEDKDGYLNIQDLTRMLERLGAPQTRTELKGALQEAGTDPSKGLTFRDLLQILRRARAGELDADSSLGRLAAATEVDVKSVGVTGAKDFFEAKIKEQTIKSKFEEEIRQEQEDRKREEEERAQKRAEFSQKMAVFK